MKKKVVIILLIATILFFSGAYLYLFPFQNMQDLDVWRFFVSILSYLSGIALLLLLIFSTVKENLENALYGFGFELFLLACLLLVLSIVVFKHRQI